MTEIEVEYRLSQRELCKEAGISRDFFRKERSQFTMLRRRRVFETVYFVVTVSEFDQFLEKIKEVKAQNQQSRTKKRLKTIKKKKRLKNDH